MRIGSLESRGKFSTIPAGSDVTAAPAAHKVLRLPRPEFIGAMEVRPVQLTKKVFRRIGTRAGQGADRRACPCAAKIFARCGAVPATIVARLLGERDLGQEGLDDARAVEKNAQEGSEEVGEDVGHVRDGTGT